MKQLLYFVGACVFLLLSLAFLISTVVKLKIRDAHNKDVEAYHRYEEKRRKSDFPYLTFDEWRTLVKDSR